MSPEFAPIDCQTEEELCRLQTDHYELNDFWISHHGAQITIYQQRSGEKAMQEIGIPKRQFDALVAWYQRKQKV